MDQTIGIGYGVEGVDQVEQANNRVIGSFEKIVSKIGNMTGQVERFGAAMSGVQKSMGGMAGMSMTSWTEGSATLKTAATRATTFKDALVGLPRRAYNASAAIDRLTGSISGYVAEMKTAVGVTRSFGAQTIGGVAPGGKAGGATGGNIKSDRSLGWMVPRFMFAWRAGSEALRAARFGAVDVLMGRAREKLGFELGQLSPLGFDTNLKHRTETSAKLFNQRFWTITSEEYTKAMAQTASAFDVTKIGYGNLERMNEASIKFSMVSKITQEKAADLVQKTILAFMTGLPEEISKKLNEGGKADVKGYGKVDLGGLAEGIGAQLGKTIAVSAIWGPGIQAGFRGALPSLVDKGWDLPAAMALIGSYVDVGFQPGQGGKAVRDIFEKEPANMAKTLLYGMGKWESESSRLDAATLSQHKKINKAREEAAVPLVNKWLKSPDTAMKLFGILGDIIQKAEKNNVDMSQFKFSKYYLPMLRMTFKKPFQERYKYLKNEIEGATPQNAAKNAEETLQDAGTAWIRISNAFSDFASTMADTPLAHIIAKVVVEPLNAATSLGLMQKTIEREHLSIEQTEELFQANRKRFESQIGAWRTERIHERMLNIAKGRGPVSEADTVWDREGLNGDVFSALGRWYWRNQGLTAPGASMTDDFNNLVNWGDQAAESARKAVSDFWENSISIPFSNLGATVDSWTTALSDSIAYPFKRIDEFFTEIGAKIDQYSSWFMGDKKEPAPPIPQTQEGLPGPFQPVEPAFNPFRFGSYSPQQPIHIELASQPLHIDNRMVIDSRVLAQAVAEIIQQNRDTYYHGFGGDPTGFQVI